MYEYSIAPSGLSMGTALAFESYLLDGIRAEDDPPIVPPKPLKHYTQIWVNLYTIIRNHISAYTTDDLIKISNNDLTDIANTIMGELLILDNIHKKIIVYRSEFNNVYTDKVIKRLRDYPNPTAKIKSIKHELTNKLSKKIDSSMYRSIPGMASGTRTTRALILTHLPYDLLGYKRFGELHLLESNTGRVKKPIEFNTKYYKLKGESLDMMPFNDKFLMFFGDNHMFKPFSYKLRKEVLEIAKKNRWAPTSTDARIASDLRSNKTLYLAYKTLGL